MRRRIHLLAACTLLVGLVAADPVQAAAPGKSFHESLAVTQGGVAVTQPLAPASAYQLRFTLTNDARSPQAFGSGRILVPSGYVVTGAATDVSRFSATTSPGSVLVRNSGPTSSGIAPGSALTVIVSVTTPTVGSCRAGWPTAVKQSNDFSGTGNDFQPADPAPTTTAGSRRLAFGTQPHLTQWDTAMAPAPTVTALDPCGSADSGYTGSVTLTDLGQLATGSVATAAAGVATFSALTFNDYGITDTLTASAAGFDAVTSQAFDVVQSLVPCAAGKTCATGTLSDHAASMLVSITAATGSSADVLTATVKGDPSVFGTCGQPAGPSSPPLGSVVTFNVTTRSKTVTMTLPKAYVQLIPNNGTPFMDICLDVPAAAAFVDKFGHTVTTGLLPDCTASRTTVCIASRGKNAGNEVITVLLPPGDPRGSWF